jgi:hypothetical protein
MRKVLIFLILLFVAVFTASAQERLTDKDVKALMVRVDEGRDRFEDSLEGKLKGAMYRSATAEVDVGKALDEFQANMDEMKDRFTDNYSASSETAKILRQGSNIDGFMKGHPGMKGSSEWDHLASDLKALAAVYGTEFPLPEGAAVRRMNDKEVAMAADSLAKQADQLKKQISKDKTIPKDQQEIYKQDIEAFQKSAKTLKSRLSDSKPSSSEARAVMDQAAQIGKNLEAGTMSPAISTAWSTMQASLSKLGQAFGE